MTTDLSTRTSDPRVIVAKVGSTDYHEWAASRDGVHWRSIRKPPSDLGPVKTSVCDGTIGCFRAGGDRVEQLRGSGRWVTAFAFTSQQVDNRQERVSCGGATREFTSLAIIGQRVVVGMGDDGLLVRRPGGRWVRRGFLGHEPLRIDGAAWMRDFPILVFLAVGGVLGLNAAVMFVRRLPRYSWGLVAAMVGMAMFISGLGFIVFLFDFADAWILSLVLGGSILVLVASVESARHFHASAAMTPAAAFVDGPSAERFDGPGESADFPEPPTS